MRTPEEILKKCVTLLQTKDNEYRLSDDPFENFNYAAKLNNCTKEQALWGFVTKHIVSLSTNIRECKKLYSIPEKAMDIINYMVILIRMIEYGKEQEEFCHMHVDEPND